MFQKVCLYFKRYVLEIMNRHVFTNYVKLANYIN
jgi:hypothetical protein